MNVPKLVAIVVAVLINCGVLAWLNSWSANIVAGATHVRTHAAQVHRLPTISVRPTRARLEKSCAGARERGPLAPTTSAAAPVGDAGVQALLMPYYSFADRSDAGRNG